MLAVVHNVTAATRLLDVAELVGGDLRVQTTFTVPPYSAFVDGTEQFLADLGIRPLPWDVATTRHFDLAVAASHGGDLRKLDAPRMIIPHGMGYNKYLLEPGARSPEPGARSPEPVFGLSAEWLLDDGELIPSSLVLSHAEQLDRLVRDCADAAGVAVLAGDPCLDRMLASRPLRAVYRRALGTVGDRRLVVVSSTWGEASLFGRYPDLPARLAANLPLDDYRVVLALHPNVWQWHTPWQIQVWTESAHRAGVRLLPAAEGWRAALVAADLVVGDHGSVTFYGAALGVPTVLAAAPTDVVAPDSAIGRFIRLAPRLDHDRPYPEQLDALLERPAPAGLASVTALATSAPEQAMSLVRKEFYRLLDLPEPIWPAEPLTIPVPPDIEREPGAQLVRVELTERRAVITRYPAELVRVAHGMPRGAHLSVDVTEPYRVFLELAEIVVVPDARDAAAVLASMPGCLLAVGMLDARSWLVIDATGLEVRCTGDAALARVCASVVHAWLTSGRDPEELRGALSLGLGAGTHVVTVERVQLPPDPLRVGDEPAGLGDDH
ncbi:MAG: hypothetical protein GEU98_18900 [Pseudonocardiaceae bacterium]|nr:hypothetical protein [Pseudonocardiaceae bacterium]